MRMWSLPVRAGDVTSGHAQWFDPPQIWLELYPYTVGKQTHDLTVIAIDSKTAQSGGDNRKKFPLGAALQVPQNFSFAPL
jgi:hypothetical protein